jgi:Uma2 family endonuclease
VVSLGKGESPHAIEFFEKELKMAETLANDPISGPVRKKRARRAPDTAAGINTSLAIEERRLLVSDRPITFEQWVDRGGRDLYELVNGSLVEMMAAQLDHERLFAWLFRLLGGYVEARNLGEVLGSRTAVRISEFGGRLPDIVFVREERKGILKQRGFYAEPDLIIEIRSPGDRPSDITALEAEYRIIGVAEIWFIDTKKRRVRVLVKSESGYAERVVTTDSLTSTTVEGFSLSVEWLWDESWPEVLKVLRGLLAE